MKGSSEIIQKNNVNLKFHIIFKTVSPIVKNGTILMKRFIKPVVALEPWIV